MESDDKLINLIEKLDADKHNLLLWKEFFSLLFEEELAKNNEEILVNLLSVKKYVQTCSMALCFISLFYNKEFCFKNEIARKAIESVDNWIALIDKLDKIGFPRKVLLKTFNEKLASISDNSILYYCRGNLFRDMNEVENAKTDFLKCIEIDPTNAYGWHGLGNSLFRSDPVQSEKAYKYSIELNPNDTIPWFCFGYLLTYYYPKRQQEAEEAYRKAIGLDPNFAKPWYGLGILLSKNRKRLKEAEDAFRKSIELDHNFTFTWYDLGNLLSDDRGRLQEAEDSYRKAIELDPNFALSWNGLGNLLSDDRGRLQEAEEAYRKSIELDQNHANPWNGLGNLLSKYYPKRRQEAEEAYRKSIELDENDAYPWNDLGNLLSDDRDRLQEAEDAFRKALELDDNSKLPWNGLGILLSKDPLRLKEAEDAFRNSLNIDPTFHKAWFNLGSLYEYQYKNTKEAFLCYNCCLRAYENYTPVWFKYIRAFDESKLYQNYNSGYVHFFKDFNVINKYLYDDFFFGFDVAAILKILSFDHTVDDYKSIKENSYLLTEILKRENLPLLTPRVYRISNDYKGIELFQDETLKSAYFKLFELIKYAQNNKDILLEAIIRFIGGDPISAYKLLNDNETEEDSDNFMFQYYLYKTAHSFFYEESIFTLEYITESIEKNDWNKRYSAKNTFYAALLCYVGSIYFKEKRSSLLSKAKQILAPLDEFLYCKLLRLIICIELNELGQIRIEVDQLIIQEQRLGIFKNLLNKRFLFEDVQHKILREEVIQCILHFYELVPHISVFVAHSDFFNRAVQEQLPDDNNSDSANTERTYESIEKIVEHFHDRISLYKPYDFWELSEGPDNSTDLQLRINQWLVQAEADLNKNKYYRNIIKHRRQPAEYVILCLNFSKESEVTEFELLIEYMALNNNLKSEERFCLKVFANICRIRNCIGGISKDDIKNISNKVLSYSLLGGNEILECLDIFDGDLKKSFIDRMLDPLFVQFDNKALNEIEYDSLIKCFNKT